MKNYFIYYIILITNFMYGYGSSYIFQTEVEYVDGEEIKGPSIYSPWNVAFPNVEETLRDEMCARAEKFHFGEPEGANPSKAERLLYIVDEKYVIKCTTVPSLYLRRNEKNNKGEMVLVIMMERNEYMGSVFGSSKFDTVTVQSDPVSCRESFLTNRNYIDTDPREVEELRRHICDENKVLRASYLWKFSETRRFHLCDAAAKRCVVEGNSRPIMQNNRVDEAQIFEIRSPIFNQMETENRVALRCPTRPRIHVYFRNIRENNDVEVLVTVKQYYDGVQQL